MSNWRPLKRTECSTQGCTNLTNRKMCLRCYDKHDQILASIVIEECTIDGCDKSQMRPTEQYPNPNKVCFSHLADTGLPKPPNSIPDYYPNGEPTTFTTKSHTKEVSRDTRNFDSAWDERTVRISKRVTPCVKCNSVTFRTKGTDVECRSCGNIIS